MSETVGRRLRRASGFWVWLVVALATPPAIVWAAYGSWQQATTPDAGISVNHLLRMESADERWTRIQRGDRVLRIDGQQVTSPEDVQRRILSEGMGALVEIEVERGSDTISEAARTQKVAPLDQLAVWLRLLTGAALILLGLVTFVLRPEELSVRLMSAFSVSVGMLLLAKMAMHETPSLYYPIGSGSLLLSCTFTVHFLLVFPQPLFGFDKQPRRALWLYGLAIAGVALDRLLIYAIGDEHNLPATGVLGGALAAVYALGGAGLTISSFIRVRKTGDKRDIARMRAIAVGLLLGLGLPTLRNITTHSLGLPATPFSAHYNTALVILFPVLAAYATVRHNALAIDRFTAAVMGYVITLGVLGGAFAGAIFGLPLIIGEQLKESPVLLVLVTGACVTTISPLYRWLKRLLDKRFARDEVDTQRMAEAIRKLVFSIQEASGEQALKSALKSSTILQPANAQLWVLDTNGETFERKHVVGSEPDQDALSSLPRRSRVADELSRGVGGGLEGLAPRLMALEAQRELVSMGLALVVPVLAHGVLAGFVGLGRKRSGGAFMIEDLSFLSVVGAQVGLALERSSSDSKAFGRYRIEKRIGMGGMAEVFLAWQVGPSGFERKVALKRPLPQLADEPRAATMFLDEARIASQLAHPSIAKVFDVGQHEGTYFIAMEYVDGPSLRDTVTLLKSTQATMPLHIAAGIIVPVLDALHYAHEKRDDARNPLRIVHRDVTPRNVHVDRLGCAKLLDFGIARATSRVHKTQTGTVRGTLPYMSPEQILGGELDRRSDVYSVGVVLYELLTLKRAFPDGPREEGPDLDSLLGHGADFLKWLLCSLSWEREDRFATAAQMRDTLVEILGEEIASQAEVASWVETLKAASRATAEIDAGLHDWMTETLSSERATT